MTDLKPIKYFLLKALLAAGNQPLADGILIDSAVMAIVPRPTRSDIEYARNELEREKYISGNRHGIMGLTWRLTDSGEHEAKQLN